MWWGGGALSLQISLTNVIYTSLIRVLIITASYATMNLLNNNTFHRPVIYIQVGKKIPRKRNKINDSSNGQKISLMIIR